MTQNKGKEAVLSSIRILWTDKGIEMEFAHVRPEDLKEALEKIVFEDDGSVEELVELYTYVLESLLETKKILERRLVNE